MLRFCSRGYYSAVSRLLIYLFVYFIDVLRLTQEYFICATAASITVGGNPKVVRSPCVWLMTLRTHLLKKNKAKPMQFWTTYPYPYKDGTWNALVRRGQVPRAGSGRRSVSVQASRFFLFSGLHLANYYGWRCRSSFIEFLCPIPTTILFQPVSTRGR